MKAEPEFTPLTNQETIILTAEKAVPAHLLHLMSDEIMKAGYLLRPDIINYLNVAAAAPFKDINEFLVRTAAKMTDDITVTLLHDLSPDDPREGFMVGCYFCLLLVDEELLAQPDNQAVLAAGLLIEEMKEHGEDWDFGEARLRERAKATLTRAQLQGLYLRKYTRVRQLGMGPKPTLITG